MFNNLRNRRAFQKARTEAGEGEIVCGTLAEDGTPLYFTMAADASEEELAAEAFQLRHGRPMSSMERTFLNLAIKQRKQLNAQT